MNCHISVNLSYTLRAPVTLLLNFRPSSSGLQTVLNESLTVAQGVKSEFVVSQPEQNRFDRFKVDEGEELNLAYEAVVETNHQLLDPDGLRQLPPDQLDQRLMPYLFPSRYCQSDKLIRFAWQKFGQITPIYDQVLQIAEWIHKNVEYIQGETTSLTSAYDTVTQCAGVCRDFAHLGIALCRALNIPARYCTGYAYQLNPPDFHACFEAFIGGHWILFDATQLAPLNSLVRIGIGRDAADVAVCTAFGIVYPGQYQIYYTTNDPGFRPLSAQELAKTAISLDGLP